MVMENQSTSIVWLLKNYTMITFFNAKPKTNMMIISFRGLGNYTEDKTCGKPLASQYFVARKMVRILEDREQKKCYNI